MHHLVVVDEHDVALLHGHARQVLHRHLVDVSQVLVRDLGEVAVEAVGDVDLGRARGLAQLAVAVVAQLARVRVHVAEPRGLPRHRVPVDRRLLGRESHEPQPVLLVLIPAQLELHVDLLADGRLRQDLDDTLERLLERLERLGQAAQEVEEGQLRVGEAHAPLVQPAKHVRVEVLDHLDAVEQQELAARLGLLEADEGAQPVRTHVGRLGVHAHEELSARRLVDGLVHCILRVHDGARAHAGEWVLARLEVQLGVEVAEAVLLLHRLEAADPQRARRGQPRQQLVFVCPEVLELTHALGNVGFLNQVGERAVHGRRRRHCRLQVDAVGVPLC
mmetsp:Transcript_31575/g.74549  ORF Transcript_31575/g.74549 Transcript_31575/m.74549 type:complete len:333 (-) Transcript_31575:221-1219(-)|eukprot:scaffold112155_cov63-Phaeocystis_antarctica.AAC.2